MPVISPLSGPDNEMESKEVCSSFAALAALDSMLSMLVRKENIVGVPSSVILAGTASSFDGRILL